MTIPFVAAMDSRKRLMLVSVLLSITTMTPMGYTRTSQNTAFETLKAFINESMLNRGIEMDKATFSWIWSTYLNIWFPGYLLGTLAAPKITDHFGRKKGIMISNLINIIGAVISLFSLLFLCPELLIVSRVAVAMASAIGMSSLILYLQEAAPTSIRGKISSYPELGICLSNLLGSICGLQYVFGNNLYILLGLLIIPNSCALLFLTPCPETPKYLLIHKKDKVGALESITFFHGTDVDREKIIESINAENENATSGRKTSLTEIWQTPYLRTALFVGTVALLWQTGTGNWIMLFISRELFVRAGLSSFAADMGTVGMLALMCISTFLAINIMDRCGRRRLLLGFGGANIVCVAAFTVCEALQKSFPWASYGCLIAVLASFATFSLGPGPVPWILTAEMVPQRQRALVQSIGLIIRCGVAFFVGLMTLPLYDVMNSYSFIPLFIIPSIIFCLYLYKMMPETKGQEVHVTVTKMSMVCPTSPYINKCETKI